MATSSQLKTASSEASILKTFLKAQDRLVYQTADLSLGSLAGMTTPKSATKRAAIDLDPDFQRRTRWTPEKQSLLIESFLLNVPVPPIYLAEDELGQYSVVDGKQRLTAIYEFMTLGLKLVGLENFQQLNGFGFNDLPDDLKNALTIRPYVRVVTLLKQSDPSLKFEVFTRLNRGGEAMLPQELRKVAYRGSLSDAIYAAAESSKPLRAQLKITNSKSTPFVKMEDAEFVLRFLALSDTWTTFSGGLRQELDGFMDRNRRVRGASLTRVIDRFSSAMETCDAIWGGHAFQRHAGTVWRAQFLAGMYDAEMLAVDSLTKTQRVKAIAHKQAAIKATAALFKDASFDSAVRQGTNTPSFVRKRVTAVLEMLRAL